MSETKPALSPHDTQRLADAMNFLESIPVGIYGQPIENTYQSLRFEDTSYEYDFFNNVLNGNIVSKSHEHLEGIPFGIVQGFSYIDCNGNVRRKYEVVNAISTEFTDKVVSAYNTIFELSPSEPIPA